MRSSRLPHPLTLSSDLDFQTGFVTVCVLWLLHVPANHFKLSVVHSSGASEKRRIKPSAPRQNEPSWLPVFLLKSDFEREQQSEALLKLQLVAWPRQASMLCPTPFSYISFQMISCYTSPPLSPQSGSKLADAIWSYVFWDSCRGCKMNGIQTSEDCLLHSGHSTLSYDINAYLHPRLTAGKQLKAQCSRPSFLCLLIP